MNSEPYTPEELAALEATAEKATPGKRFVVRRVPPTRGRRYVLDVPDTQSVIATTVNGGITIESNGGIFPAADDAQIATFDRETCLRLIRQLRQQTARADQEERLNRQRDDLALHYNNAITDRDAWKARAEAAERELATQAQELTICEREYEKLAQEQHQDTNTAMREALGRKLWDHLWGPELEQLGHIVDRAFNERDAARTALAVVEVERAKLVTALQEVQRLVQHLSDGRSRDVYVAARDALAAASPHADLAAVRALVKDAEAVKRDRECAKEWPMATDAQVPWHSITRLVQSLAALPNWCREQP